MTGRPQKEITKRSSALSLPTSTQRKSRKPNFRLWPKKPSKRGTLPLLNLPSYSRKQGDTRERRDTLIPQTTKFKLCQNFEGNRPANSTHSVRTCHSLPSPSVTPDTLRTRTSHVLLSTSCISWHNMSRAMWQLNAYLRHLPILKEEGDCVAGSMWPDAVQRVITHVVFTRAT